MECKRQFRDAVKAGTHNMGPDSINSNSSYIAPRPSCRETWGKNLAPTALRLRLFLGSDLILHQPSQMPKFINIMRSSTVTLLIMFPRRNLLEFSCLLFQERQVRVNLLGKMTAFYLPLNTRLAKSIFKEKIKKYIYMNIYLFLYLFIYLLIFIYIYI
jgi:hypothetical protein